MAHAAPGAHGHRRLRTDLPDGNVVEVVGDVEGAFDLVLVGRVGGHGGHQAAYRVITHGLRGHAVGPGRHAALRIDCGTELGQGGRPVHVVLHVFFAGP